MGHARSTAEFHEVAAETAKLLVRISLFWNGDEFV